MDLGLSGLASGFDWRSLVEQLSEVERAPQRRLASEQTTLDLRKNAYASITTQLNVLQNRVNVLKAPGFFDSRQAVSGDESIATATAGTGTALGSYSFNISQLATASAYRGSSNIGQALHSSNDVSGLVLSEAPFSLAPTAGTFTVNGKQITIATSDTLQAVFDKISTATGGSVTGSYDSATDQITLAGSGEIVLGSATDSSNFLQAAKLSNNGTDTISSSAALGTVRLESTLDAAGLAIAIDDGGAGAGEFKINGVSIAFDTASDSMTNVINRINSSSAGVTASYDTVEDRLVLTNKTTGDIGVALEDVTGNFLAATGLQSGTLARGKNLLYTVNNGAQLSSQSNLITPASSSIPGLSVSALKTGTVNVEVKSDTESIKSAINGFLAEYNKSQTMIDAETSSSTDGDGVVTAGELAGEYEANDVASRLRSLVNQAVSGLSETLNQLSDMGINSNGNDDTLAITDNDAFENALANHLSAVRDLFAGETNGLAIRLETYLESTVGDEGLLVTKQNNISKQIADIDTQISDMERLVLANEERLIQSFINMELAQSRINQQIAFLANKFGGTTSA